MAKKYHIIVFGCQMNVSDAERVAAVLESAKYEKTDNINQANLVVVVMCSVRQSAVDRVVGLSQKLRKVKSANPEMQTVLTGCILKKDQKKLSELFDYIINIKEISDIHDLLRSAPSFYGHASPAIAGSLSPRRATPLRGDHAGTPAGVLQNLVPRSWDYLEITPKYFSKKSAFVPIMTGCNNFCSYCVVPYTRGREISRPAKEIIYEVKNLIKNGSKEIWLLGQNVNSYNGLIRANKPIKFRELLKMVNDIPGDFKLNFLTSHPKDFSDELIKTMAKCKKLSKRLNLPIQSGDDKILKKMNRPYTVAQYKNLVKKIRKTIPNISISTDVIVGFPGETKKQFENTVKTFKEIGFDIAFVNKYSPRPGTAAAKMGDNVPWAEKKRREKVLIDLINK